MGRGQAIHQKCSQWSFLGGDPRLIFFRKQCFKKYSNPEPPVPAPCPGRGVSMPGGRLLQFLQARATNTTECPKGAGVRAVPASCGMITRAIFPKASLSQASGESGSEWWQCHSSVGLHALQGAACPWPWLETTWCKLSFLELLERGKAQWRPQPSWRPSLPSVPRGAIWCGTISAWRMLG